MLLALVVYDVRRPFNRLTKSAGFSSTEPRGRPRAAGDRSADGKSAAVSLAGSKAIAWIGLSDLGRIRALVTIGSHLKRLGDPRGDLGGLDDQGRLLGRRPRRLGLGQGDGRDGRLIVFGRGRRAASDFAA